MWVEYPGQENNLWGGTVMRKQLRVYDSHSPTICAEETFLTALMSSTWNTKIVTKGESNSITGESTNNGIRPCFPKAKLLSKSNRTRSKGTAPPPLYYFLISPARDIPCWTLLITKQRKRKFLLYRNTSLIWYLHLPGRGKALNYWIHLHEPSPQILKSRYLMHVQPVA